MTKIPLLTIHSKLRQIASISRRGYNTIDMEGALDEFILWSGWIAALGIAIYEIAKAFRNRIRIEVSLTISEGDICIGAHNWGRRPVNFVETGLRYANGMSFVFDDLGEFFPQILYRNDGRNMCFKINEVVKQLKSHNTQIMYGYFADEAGRQYKMKPSNELRHYISELLTSEKTNLLSGRQSHDA